MATTNITNTATGAKGYQVPGAATPAGWTASPTQVSGAVTSALTPNPHDAIGYNPATDPTSTTNPNSPNYNQATQVTNGKTPATPPVTPTVPAATPTGTASSATPAAVASAPSGIPGDIPLTGTQSDQATQAIDQLKAKYGKALTDITGTGIDAPQSQGSASAGINAALKTQPDPQKPTPIPQSVQTFSDPSQNPLVDDQMAQLREFLSPASDRQQLNDSIAQLSADRSALSGLKTELLNVKNIMSGSADDIRKEIEASGGFGTNSQVMALAAARNIPLLKKSQDLSDQIQSQTDLVNSDISLVGDEKQMAATQFSENMSMLNFQQQNNKDLANAFQTNVELIQKTAGWAGVLQAYGSNPNQLAYVDSLYGGPGSIAKLAAVPDVQSVKDSLEIQGLKLDNAKKAADLNGGSTGGTTQVTTSNGNVNVPTLISPYYKVAYDGTPYADLSSLTPSDKAKYAQISQAAGIKPILDAGTSSKLSAISVSKENLQNIGDSLTAILSNSNPSSQGLSNSIASFFGNADIKSYNAWRTAIINNVQALAGGQGSGLRINKAEIDSAMQNDLPVITGVHADNLSTAQAKIAKLNSQLDTWSRQILGGGNTANSHIPPIGTVVNSGGKSYHVIDAQGNLQPI